MKKTNYLAPIVEVSQAWGLIVLAATVALGYSLYAAEPVVKDSTAPAVAAAANPAMGATKAISENDPLQFKLTISPVEWTTSRVEWTNLSDLKAFSPVLLLWWVTNKTAGGITLPVGTPTNVELVDANNHPVDNPPYSEDSSKSIDRGNYVRIGPG